MLSAITAHFSRSFFEKVPLLWCNHQLIYYTIKSNLCCNVLSSFALRIFTVDKNSKSLFSFKFFKKSRIIIEFIKIKL